MKHTQWGCEGLDLPCLGLGCWTFGGGTDDYWGASSLDAADRLVGVALDQGAHYFDTAPIYNDGRSEEVLGRVLKGRRDRAVIGTKFLPELAEPDRLRRACEDSLRRLQTETIDLYMIHWPIRDVSLEGALAEMEALKTEGKIRHIGVSNYGPKDLRQAVVACPSIAVNQMLYNLLSRAVEAEVLPICRETGIGLMAYMPLLQGLLTGKYRKADEAPPNRVRTRHFRGDRPLSRHGGPGAEDAVFACIDELRCVAEGRNATPAQVALAWLIAKGVACVLAGARDASQLMANIRGIEETLSDEDVSRLDAASQPVFDALGSRGDYWESEEADRIR